MSSKLDEIIKRKEHFLKACDEFYAPTLDIEEMKSDYEFLCQTIKEQQEEIDDQTKWADTYFKELQQTKENIGRYKKEIIKLRGETHLSCPNCHEDCMGWVSDGEPCGNEW